MKCLFLLIFLLTTGFAEELREDLPDAELYKILIFLAKDEGNDAEVIDYMQRLAHSKVIVSASDIYLYVREAVAIEEYELAQKLIDRVKNEMKESKPLLAAQEYLNQHREEI